jgi:hypothetical protein
MTEEKFKEKCYQLYEEYLMYKDLAKYGQGHVPIQQLQKFDVLSMKRLYQLKRFEMKHPEYNF